MLLLNRYIKIWILITASIFLFKNNAISQNLIQNPSFEFYTEDIGTSHCVTNFSSMINWQQVFSPDVFVKPCTFVNHYGVPYNTFGCSYPKNGDAYIGLGLLNMPNETKEYIYQYLTSPLISGKTYYTSFFLSKSDRTRIAPEKELQVIAFPNPANTDVNFVIDGIAENETCTISIYDINGRLMTEFTIQENKLPKSISLTTFSSGIYFYKAVTGDKIYQNKLVIIK